MSIKHLDVKKITEAEPICSCLWQQPEVTQEISMQISSWFLVQIGPSKITWQIFAQIQPKNYSWDSQWQDPFNTWRKSILLCSPESLEQSAPWNN